MSDFRLRSRAPRGAPTTPRPTDDPDVIATHLEDAAHFGGGHSPRLYSPTTEAEIAAILQRSDAVLPIGAQSSLTGGATPLGEVLLSTHRLNRIVSISQHEVTLEAGVTLEELDRVLAHRHVYYPPAPTFTGAFVGGTVSTNAAGAATFKYGTTRPWVQALTVVLANGDVLDIRRGTKLAHADGYFEFDLSTGLIQVPVPTYQMPAVAKLSAGYFAAPRMDAIDLFIGSEGTLGVITEVTLRTVAPRPALCLAFVTFRDQAGAMSVVRRLRDAAQEAWRCGGASGIDVSGIEFMDSRCLGLIREDGLDVKNGVVLTDEDAVGLLITLELPPSMTAERAYFEIASVDGEADTALIRYCRLLREHGVLERTTLAVPGDRARAAQLIAIREAVPAAVNARVGLAKRTIDMRIDKTAADVIVPFDHLEPLLEFCGRELARLELDGAIWGHISDGNVHPNVIPQRFDDVQNGREAVLAFGREAIRLGGAPLAEHGVGRNPTKQKLLAELYGQQAIDEMQQVKRAFDPNWKLSPGVIFGKGSDTCLTPV